MKRKRRTAWPVWKLVKENRSAPAVWLALLELANGRKIVTPTREQIAHAAGISRRPTVSAALTTLADGGWIDRMYKPVFQGGRQTATLLRIAMLRRERKSFPTQTAVENENRSLRRKSRRERKSFPDSPSERGRNAADAGVLPADYMPPLNLPPPTPGIFAPWEK